MAEKKEKSKAAKIVGAIRGALFTVLLIVLVSIIAITLIVRVNGGTPSFFGYTVYRVSSGSMAPELEIGDVILVQSVDPLSVKNGDIITYESESGSMSGKTITHRVIKEPFLKDSEYYLRTKGDANSYEDADISVSQVKGTFLAKISILKSLYSFFITPWGLLSIIALVVLAFFNELVILIKAIFGIGYEKEPKESVEEIIERYQKQNAEEKLPEKQEQTDDSLS